MFPDTDVIARAVLLQGFAEHGITGVGVATKLPSPVPDRFVRCFTLPGREICIRTQWVQVVAQVYDTDEVRCSQLARLSAAILRAAPDTVIDGQQPVGEPCEKQGPYPSQDPDLPHLARYQLTVTWTIHSSLTAAP